MPNDPIMILLIVAFVVGFFICSTISYNTFPDDKAK